MKIQTIIPYIALVVVLLLWQRTCNKAEEAGALYSDAQAELEVSVDAQGRQTGRIKLLEAENAKAFLSMQTSDSNIIALQSIVEAYKGRLFNATRLVNATRDRGSSETSISFNVDSVPGQEVVRLFPTYATEWDEQWSSGEIIASKDSIVRDIRVKNEYEITQGKERLGLFKGSETVIKIKNLNPMTETEELRTFRVKENKKISIGVQVGVGIMQSGLGWYGGVGVQYKLMEL